MVQIEQSKYGNVYLDVSKDNTVVFVSGGLDSAVLLYLIAKEIKLTKSKTNLHVLTARRMNPTSDKTLDRVDNLIPAQKVIDYVYENTGVKVKEHHTMQAEYYWLTTEVNGKMVSSYSFAQETLTHLMIRRCHKLKESVAYYNGVTMNPPKESVPQSEESHRDNIISGIEGTVSVANGSFMDAFRNADKRITIDLAKKYGILEDLLDFTRTCEGNGEKTNNYTTDCGECWWCLEKQWALENA